MLGGSNAACRRIGNRFASGRFRRLAVERRLAVYLRRTGLIIMLGMLFDEKECRELNYLLRREMDEMLLDLNDSRMDGQIKEAIISRYKVIFRMYARLATPKELSRYAPGRNIR